MSQNNGGQDYGDKIAARRQSLLEHLDAECGWYVEARPVADFDLMMLQTWRRAGYRVEKPLCKFEAL